MMFLQKNKTLLLLLLVTSFIFSREKMSELSIEINPNLNSKKITPYIKKLYKEACVAIEKKLSLDAPKKARILICASHKEMNILSGVKLPSWATGVAFSSRNLILINYQNVDMLANSLPAVLEHEICHLYLGQWEIAHNLALPQWFNEGICEWISGRMHFQHNIKIFDHAIWDRLIPLKELNERFPANAERASLAYVEARDIVIYMAKNHGSENISKIIHRYAQTKNFATAVQQITKTSISNIENAWTASITPQYKWFWRFTQLFSLFTIMAVLTILAYNKQKKRKKRLMEKWEKEDEFYENIGY